MNVQVCWASHSCCCSSLLPVGVDDRDVPAIRSDPRPDDVLGPVAAFVKVGVVIVGGESEVAAVEPFVGLVRLLGVEDEAGPLLSRVGER